MRGELPSQEQTTCSGNSCWSSVSHIDWDFRARAPARAPARTRARARARARASCFVLWSLVFGLRSSVFVLGWFPVKR